MRGWDWRPKVYDGDDTLAGSAGSAANRLERSRSYALKPKRKEPNLFRISNSHVEVRGWIRTSERTQNERVEPDMELRGNHGHRQRWRRSNRLGWMQVYEYRERRFILRASCSRLRARRYTTVSVSMNPARTLVTTSQRSVLAVWVIWQSRQVPWLCVDGGGR